MWPSEQILGYYVYKNIELFKDKRVCELGGGRTALAGMILAKFGVHVLLSDGNQQCVQALKANAQINFPAQTNPQIEQIIWSEEFQWHEEKFDALICADCFFFKKYLKGLVSSIPELLHVDGKAYFIAPERDGTLQLFIQLIKETAKFNIQIFEHFDEEVDLALENEKKICRTEEEKMYLVIYLIKVSFNK